MKIWCAVPVDVQAWCGRCGLPIPPGAVVLVYLGATSTPGATWIKFRCATCADERAPAAAGLPWLPPTRAALREWRDQ